MKNFSLILGSGGVKGLAHIGVLRYLEEINLKPEVIIGSSAGSLIGALKAKGLDSREIQELLLTSRSLKLLDFSNFKESIMHGKKINAFLEKHLNLDFDELKIPLIVNAVDLKTGKEVKLNKGLVCEAIRASISIPGVVKPVKRDDMLLVDAGFTDPLPFQYVPRSKKVLAVDVSSSLLKLDDNPSIIAILRQSFYITQNNAATRTKKLYFSSNLAPENFKYLKLDLSKHDMLNFIQKDEDYKQIISYGYETAKKELKSFK